MVGIPKKNFMEKNCNNRTYASVDQFNEFIWCVFFLCAYSKQECKRTYVVFKEKLYALVFISDDLKRYNCVKHA